MSIDTMEVYSKCPNCGRLNTRTDYHENTSSDRSQLFGVLNAPQFVCKYCSAEIDADFVYTAQYSQVEDKEYYKKRLKNALGLFCANAIPFISFSDWDYEISGEPRLTEQPALNRLCAMYPDDQDFRELAHLYHGVRLYGKFYVNKLETGDAIITPSHIRMSSGLRKVYLRDGVQVIAEHTFRNCRALRDIFLPDTVIHIESEAFMGAGLERIRISSRLKTMGKSAFAGCTMLTQLFIPDSVSCIGDRCFEGCCKLTYMYIPKVISLGDHIFAACTKLEKVELPSCLKQENIREKLGIQDTVEIAWYE